MKVFVAGATGVLGRRVVKQLLARGNMVFALSRSLENTKWLKDNGVEPRRGNLFNEESLDKAVARCDAVLHLATAIPVRKTSFLKNWALNDRIRREGTQNLVRAALQKDCQLYVQQSVTFIYGDRNGEWVDETTRIPERQVSILQSAVDMERIVRDAGSKHNLPGIILRFGAFYCHDSVQTQRMFEMARRGRLPLLGSGKSFWNIINVDDAASAVVAAVENGAGSTGEIFNVCDNNPATFTDIMNFISQTFCGKEPIRIPEFFAKVALGSHIVDTLTASVRCRNDKIKQRLAWKPEFETYREGCAVEIEKWLELSEKS